MKILILGGRGFLGSKVKETLKDDEIYTFDRHSGPKKHFRGDITREKDLEKAFEKMDVVINLIGLTPLFKPKCTTYYKVHVGGVANILKACKKNKVSKIVHISALGANKNSEIEYIRTKGIAEQKIKNSEIDYNIIRPSVIFGKGSELIDMFYKSAPAMFFPKIKTKMQPIHRSDVAKIISLASKNKIRENVIEIAGNKKIPLYKIAKKIYNKRGFPFIPIPEAIFKPSMKLFAFLGVFGLGKDQVRSLNLENTTEKNKAAKYIDLTDFENWVKKGKFTGLKA